MAKDKTKRQKTPKKGGRPPSDHVSPTRAERAKASSGDKAEVSPTKMDSSTKDTIEHSTPPRGTEDIGKTISPPKDDDQISTGSVNDQDQKPSSDEYEETTTDESDEESEFTEEAISAMTVEQLEQNKKAIIDATRHKAEEEQGMNGMAAMSLATHLFRKKKALAAASTEMSIMKKKFKQVKTAFKTMRNTQATMLQSQEQLAEQYEQMNRKLAELAESHTNVTVATKVPPAPMSTLLQHTDYEQWCATRFKQMRKNEADQVATIAKEVKLVTTNISNKCSPEEREGALIKLATELFHLSQSNAEFGYAAYFADVSHGKLNVFVDFFKIEDDVLLNEHKSDISHATKLSLKSISHKRSLYFDRDTLMSQVIENNIDSSIQNEITAKLQEAPWRNDGSTINPLPRGRIKWILLTRIICPNEGITQQRLRAKIGTVPMETFKCYNDYKNWMMIMLHFLNKKQSDAEVLQYIFTHLKTRAHLRKWTETRYLRYLVDKDKDKLDPQLLLDEVATIEPQLRQLQELSPRRDTDNYQALWMSGEGGPTLKTGDALVERIIPMLNNLDRRQRESENKWNNTIAYVQEDLHKLGQHANVELGKPHSQRSYKKQNKPSKYDTEHPLPKSERHIKGNHGDERTEKGIQMFWCDNCGWTYAHVKHKTKDCRNKGHNKRKDRGNNNSERKPPPGNGGGGGGTGNKKRSKEDNSFKSLMANLAALQQSDKEGAKTTPSDQV